VWNLHENDLHIVAYKIVNKFRYMQNFNRTDTLHDNVVRMFNRATRPANGRWKCCCRINFRIAKPMLRFLIFLCSIIENQIIFKIEVKSCDFCIIAKVMDTRN
jgi:hypothetical protein